MLLPHYKTLILQIAFHADLWCMKFIMKISHKNDLITKMSIYICIYRMIDTDKFYYIRYYVGI